MLNIVLYQQKILLDISDTVPRLPTAKHLLAIKDKLTLVHESKTEFIATINGDSLSITTNNSNLELVGLRKMLGHFELGIAQKIVYYQQLVHYYATHKFCSLCGNLTTRQKENKFVYCKNCSHEIYPHIAPCIMVRIHKDDKILMARGIEFAPNIWGLIAGFVEIGESLEDAVHREVLEEVGIEIKNLKYWGSQPWPFPNSSLMLAFTADYASGTITPQATEIEDAGFFSRDNLPGMPSTSRSIASQMIMEYVKNK